ncbi:MAG TPA: hypothetical protein VFK59_11410, partial [Actinomycetota bacterium]|nr:hypothetical protein [Actinomycetota bacterium]
RRNQRVAAGVLGVAVFALAAIGFVRLLGSEGTPASDPQSPFAGTWVTDDEDPTRTMIVRVADDGAVEVTVLDDFAQECRSPATMTGTGRVEGDTRLVVPAPAYTCDLGSEPETPSGPPLAKQLRDWTLVLDPQNDTLSDDVFGVWVRAGADAGVRLEDLEPVWPQTSLEEVRQAQELADAGDPAYTWQVHPEPWQIGQNHPGNTVIFSRFLEEELGWEDYLWDEAFAHPDDPYGNDAGDVVYLRCAPSGTNPLYPDDPVGGGCAPTLDDLRYEAVQINVAQLDRQGLRGIWVVTGWRMIPAEQSAPPSDAEIDASLGAFLQARIDGEGAEAFVDFAEDDASTDEREIPLLYATSTGVPYERAEFEIVQGPTWPEGSMRIKVRLSAEKGKTMVEQLFSLERDRSGSLRLVYDFEPTIENGEAVPVEYGFLDGLVTFRAAAPFKPSQDGHPDRLAIAGRLPGDDVRRRVLVFMADPRPIGPDCEQLPAPADAEALARSLRSNPDVQANAPVAVTIGGIPALRMDVSLVPGASLCAWEMPGLSAATPLEPLPFAPVGLARIYLLDLPEGSGARVLAIATITDEDSFDAVLEFAEPIVDSIAFHPR